MLDNDSSLRGGHRNELQTPCQRMLLSCTQHPPSLLLLGHSKSTEYLTLTRAIPVPVVYPIRKHPYTITINDTHWFSLKQIEAIIHGFDRLAMYFAD